MTPVIIFSIAATSSGVSAVLGSVIYSAARSSIISLTNGIKRRVNNLSGTNRRVQRLKRKTLDDRRLQEERYPLETSFGNAVHQKARETAEREIKKGATNISVGIEDVKWREIAATNEGMHEIHQRTKKLADEELVSGGRSFSAEINRRSRYLQSGMTISAS